jgi:hypothetical protein
MPNSKLKIIDAHSHFFSYNWFQHFANLASTHHSHITSVETLAAHLGWEAPTAIPEELGKRWVEELDRFGVSKQVLFASKPNDAESLAVAVRAFPRRLIGYVMIDPTQASARDQTYYSLNLLGMKGVLLFPALHHFHAFDKKIFPIYEEAAAAAAPVFIHFGQLSIPIFKRLGLPDNIDHSFSNPADLKIPAAEFAEVKFIVPHFGCGCFEEALAVARSFPNVYFDTASSNSWVVPPLTLEEVFKQSLAALGPERILFGTDSSYFPRGWRQDIYDRQLQILNALQVSKQDQEKILGGNLARILGIGK